MKRRLCLLTALAMLAPTVGWTQTPAAKGPWFGADLSFVNEMEDCGAVFREKGVKKDPYVIFREHGANLVRIRLWNDPDWTRYSTLADVKKSIRRARALGMQVLLDFHYSDTWADGDKQIVPKAWKTLDATAQAQALHRFTYDTLMALEADGLMPELVQVGNETNGEVLGEADWGKRPINWTRNALLLNAGVRAVREAGEKSAIKPKVMLHIAQPENVEPWFEAAAKAGLTDFDQIGVSYYGKWSKYSIKGLGEVLGRLTAAYPGKDVILVETAYPWTLGWKDELGNVLGEDSLIAGYPATPEGQQRYMADVTRTVMENGGDGVVYWEPAWVSTNCKTPWGRGSSWENATFFDFNRRNELLPAIDFMRPPAGPR
ncbi:MAG: glycosyl hydrolase 53 family protein [Caulobacter sp.]|nr:glycosyl hydrolase 53 family protein [Caulobacter sp.]